MSNNQHFNLKRICSIYYSPTGTTRKTVAAIASGTGLNSRQLFENNLTFPEFADSLIDVEPEDLLVIGAPVYAGRIASEAFRRMEKIRFAANPVVLVAVYGNRHYDDALVDLREFALGQGLKPVAAGAFVGEHSYSNQKYPIAIGRPDADDLASAKAFGSEIFARFNKIEDLLNLPGLNLPGTVPLPERRVIPPAAAETIAERCVKCGKCQEICPTGAVYFAKGYKTKPELCTLCCACLKKCPQHARVINSDHLQMVRERLLADCVTRREAETFF